MIGATIYGEQSQNNHIILASCESRVYSSRHETRRTKEKKRQQQREKKLSFHFFRVKIGWIRILFPLHLFTSRCDSHAEFNLRLLNWST